MALSSDQKKLLELFGGDFEKVITTREFVYHLGGRYYHGSARYVQQRLARLVNRNILIRVKRGHYKMSGIINPQKPKPIVENQLKMF